MKFFIALSIGLQLVVGSMWVVGSIGAQNEGDDDSNAKSLQTLEEAREQGFLRSSYRSQDSFTTNIESPEPNLGVFKDEIEPLLTKACARPECR